MADAAGTSRVPLGSPAPDLWPGIDKGNLFRSLFTAYPDSLLVVDQLGRIMLANPPAAALLGYAENELIGLNVDVLVPEGIRPRHASYRAAYGHAPQPRPMGTHVELAAMRKDGSEVMVEIALSPMRDHGVPFVVAAIRDIGAYPRVKQALQRARYSEHAAQWGRLVVNTRDLQAVLNHVPGIMSKALQVEIAAAWLLDYNGLRFRLASGAGLLAGEEIGASADNRPYTWPGFIFSQGKPVVVEDYSRESRFLVPREYRDMGLVTALGVPLSDRGRIIGMLSVHSTESNRFGDEEIRFLESLSSLLATSLQRAQTEEALNHAQRLESIGQLTGGIAHDFNNLLTVIQGNLQVLEERPVIARDGHAQKLLAAAARASRRGAELTSKMLAFSRRQMLQPVVVDTHALLHSLGDMLRHTLDRRIRIEIHTTSGSPFVRTDPAQLESALLNIAINARDAMPDGGRLCFHTEICNALPAAAGVPGNRHGGPGEPAPARFLSIAVTDSGKGMSQDIKERAFEPFFTTKDTGHGTGLGLSAVYGFASQSGGAVTIESKVGHGSTVTLYLPQHDDIRPPDVPENHWEEALPSGLRVMLVEDDAEVRTVIKLFLVALGCKVTVAVTVDQALTALKAGTEPFELLLSDTTLGGGMHGTRLAEEVQRRYPRMAVLLMSGFSPELLDTADEAPSHWELLHKPCTRSELAHAMAKALAGHA